jgi:S1-C subfamily serine protease
MPALPRSSGFFVLIAFLVGVLSAVAHAAPRPAPPAPDPSWEDTISVVSRAVVSLRVRGTRDFDTERAGNSTGTAFVIDKERGLLLTNRHMVHAGPVIAEAVFLNHEEVPLEPIYRDPVHDFGFYRFDPSKVRYMQVAELPLRPERARVGLDIRIVGNDSGEKISILGGTIARLDRDAPDYGSSTYNDFNTFYFQAASNTSGGSSGSPVVDQSGAVVALNAGSRTNTASAFYLPLDRVVRAIPYVLRGETPPRGTLQASFRYTPYDELRRLGLSDAAEAAARRAFPANVGMLVVERLVPGGPAADALRPGDILVALDGRPVGSFVDLEAALDDAVGREVALTFERGGRAETVALQVGDLHAITPATWLEFSRAVLHPLSYMQARNHNVPVQGVMVAQPGYALGNAGVPSRAVLVAVDGAPTPDLESLQAALAALPDGARARVRYHTLTDPRQQREAVVRVDRVWHPMRRCTLEPATGRWPCVDLPAVAPAAAPEPARVVFPDAATRAGRRLARALVTVHFQVPYPTAGLRGTTYTGAGLVVDAEQGLVLTDRDTVPVALGDLELGFAGQARIPARIVYLHPVHNLAVLRYDPALLGDTEVATARLVDRQVAPGDTVWQVGLDPNGALVEARARVAQVGPIALGAARTPRFRDINVEGFGLSDYLASIGGVVADRRGRVLAGWLSFADPQADRANLRGLPTPFLERVVAPLRDGEPVAYRALGVELDGIGLDAARDLGLSQARADAILDHDPRERRVLVVSRVWGGAPAEQVLRNGDLLLTAEGRPLTRMRDVEALTSADQVLLEILRDGEERTVLVPTVAPPELGVERMVQWAGLILHEPHHELSAQTGRVGGGVYGSWVWYGTPAYEADLRPTRILVEVDGASIGSLDDLLEAVAEHTDGQAVRVVSEGLDGRLEVHTLKVDQQFWPAVGFAWDGARWAPLVPIDPAPAPSTP